jgi:methyl-accepting chemotaxis protein
LGGIVEHTGRVSELINGIASASEEQAQGVGQVNTAVSQMDKMTQRTAASAEQSAAAAQQLASQATAVDQIVHDLATLVGGGRDEAVPVAAEEAANEEAPAF